MSARRCLGAASKSMKRLFVLIFLCLIGLMLVLGCSGKGSTGGRADDNSLSVYNWSTFIDPEAVAQFEAEFGVKVKYDTYESTEDLYAKLQGGNPGYDVIFPSDYILGAMIAEGMLEKLNLDNIPNIQHIDALFLDPPYDPGNQYSLPYQWYTLGIGYNIKATGGEIDSWSNLFDPKFEGRVALLDDVRATLGVALLSLGYELNTTNPDEIAEARDFLIENGDAIAMFAPDTGQLLLAQGEVDLTIEWSGDIFQVMEENPDLRYVIPKEGTTVGVESMAIPKDAPHPELAEKFINFILEPEVGAKVSNFIRYATPNKAALDQGLINAEDLQNPGIYPPAEIFARLQYVFDVGTATPLYDRAWTEVKVGVGK